MNDAPSRSGPIDTTVDPARAGRVVRALLVPADEALTCKVIDVPTSAAAISDAIGGGLLDEIVHDREGAEACCAYLDEERQRKRLPENPRARLLSAFLGWPDRCAPVLWGGDVLIAGVGAHGEDEDVPERVLEAARRCGLLVGAGERCG